MNHETVVKGVYVFTLFIFIFTLGMFTQFVITIKKEERTCIDQNAHLSYKDVQNLCVENLK